MKIYYQLWSINDLLTDEQNMKVSFEKLKEIGYDGVELYHFGNMTILKSVIECAKENDLEIVSSHINFEVMRDDKELLLDIIDKTNITNIAIPIISDIANDEETLNLRLEEINKVKAELPESINLFYHNHDLESKKINDKYVFEYISEVIPMEFDTFWLLKTGMNPASCIKHYNNAPLIHFKDIKILSRENGELYITDGPVGTGNMELKKVIKACHKNNVVGIIVEQENQSSDIDQKYLDMKISYDNIKSILEGSH